MNSLSLLRKLQVLAECQEHQPPTTGAFERNGSGCRHRNLPESQVVPGSHSCISLPKTQQSYSWKCCTRLQNSTVFSKTPALPQLFPRSLYHSPSCYPCALVCLKYSNQPSHPPAISITRPAHFSFSFCSLEFKLFSSPFR